MKLVIKFQLDQLIKENQFHIFHEEEMFVKLFVSPSSTDNQTD
jgi:hypothetical protein